MYKTKNKPNEVDILIGANLKKIRMHKNLSQIVLANEIGLSFQQIQKYENGINRISVSRLIEIAKVLEVSLDSFYSNIFYDAKYERLNCENL